MAAGAKIADVFFRALLDDHQLAVDAVKAGDKAGQSLGASMSRRIAGVLKTTAFTGLAAASAIAGKGLLELQGITADFTAATGASADEAKRAGEAINEMGGRNLQPLREIGDTLTVVHTDLGLVGVAAEKTTEKFLKYGTATKQGPAAAVKAFDDILDAWGLTADHTDDIMDKLIASHQKYGGSIEENQAALAAMAPQLKALNLDIDDGIGLLDLFAASGLDAAAGQKALNSAITKLPKGESLDDFIARLSTIQDDGQRAQEAMKVFGTRAGAGLANAIRPGISSLDAFKISTDDATGATEKAADAIEGTFGNQVALKIKAVGAAIIGVGQTIGPLGSALTGLISLGGALGLDKLVAKGWDKVGHSALVRGAATKAGALIGAVYGAATEVAEHVVEVVKEAWHELLTKIEVKLAASKAGLIVGAVYGQAVATGSKIAELLTTGFAKLPMAGALRGAALAAGLAAGGAYGSGFALALAAIPFAIGVAVTFVVGKAIDPGGLKGQLDRVVDDLNTGKRVWVDVGTQAGEGIVEGASKTVETKLGPAIRDGFDQAKPFTAAAAASVSKVVSSSIGNMGANWIKVARAQARRMAGGVAQGIRDRENAVDQAWQDLLDGIKSVEAPTKRAARLLGRLASKELAAGMDDERPEVKAQAEATLQATVDELGQIVRSGGKIGKDGMKALRRAMKSTQPEVAQAATDIYNAAKHPLAQLPTKTYTYGQNAGNNFADGLESTQHHLEQVASRLAGAVGSYLKVSSPAEKGDLSQFGGPEGWGRRIVAFLTKGAAAEMPNLNRALAGFSMPSLGSQLALPSYASAVGGGSWTTPQSGLPSGGDTYNVNLLDKLEVRSVRDIGSGLRLLGESGHLVRKRKV